METSRTIMAARSVLGISLWINVKLFEGLDTFTS